MIQTTANHTSSLRANSRLHTSIAANHNGRHPSGMGDNSGGGGGGHSHGRQATMMAGNVGPPPEAMINAAGPPFLECKKNLNKMGGVSPSDIDKYSRVLFPVSFTCFNLMYWIIYLHISEELVPDLVLVGS